MTGWQGTRGTLAAIAALGIVAGASGADAQTPRFTAQPCIGAPFLIITYPAGPDKRMTDEALRQLRQQLPVVFPRRELCIVDKATADATLELSGWKPDAVLQTRDAVELAKAMRADEVLEFSVEPAGRGFQLRGRLVLGRDVWFRDSIPTPEPGENMSQAARFLAQALKPVRAQLEHEQKCYSLGREGKYAEAEAAAREGLKAFPAATISRLCLASVIAAQKKSPDEVLKLTQDVLAKDDGNALALLRAIDTYYEKSDTAAYAQVASKFVTIDPSSQYVETIVGNLAAWRKTDVAFPLLRTALEQNPEDHALLRLEFKLLYSTTERVKEVIAKGEALARIDTLAVDTLFVLQLSSAYAQDSQPQKVAEWLGTGFRKFPDNVTIATRYAQQLGALGQTNDAIAVYRRVLAMNPRAPEVRLRVARFYSDAGQTDSAVAWLRQANASGEDKEVIAGVALGIANAMLRAATPSGTLDDFKRMLAVATFADSVESTPNSMFMRGMAEYRIATTSVGLLREPATATCDIARVAHDAIVGAQQHIFAGARAQPGPAGQILPTLPDLATYLEAQVTALCRSP